MLTEAANAGTMTSSQARPDWLRLFRAPRLAIDISKLVLAAAGLILLQIGWGALNRLLPESSAVTPLLHTSPAAPSWGDRMSLDMVSWEFSRLVAWRLFEPAQVFATPLIALFTPGKSFGWYLHAGLAVLWVLSVGGIVGGAIARIAVLQVSRSQGPGALGAIGFALRYAVLLIATPLFPLIAVSLCALVCAGVGALFRLPAGIGSAVGGVLLFIPLLLSVVMACLLFGLAAGWPLLLASVAAEAEDVLDALSRSFSYLNQRLGKFVLCVVLAGVIGIPALVAIDLLATVVTHLAAWGVGLSAPASSLAGLVASGAGEGSLVQPDSLWPSFWRGVVALLVQSWIYAYFWTAAAFIYLLLRHDVDGTPWTEVKEV